MASYTISPSTNGIPLINSVPFPVPYVGSTGYAQYNYLQEVSAEKLVPYIKNVSTTEFTSGNYNSFQSPVGYTIPAHNLPCFETSEVLLASDDFTIFAPHKGYIIGSNADQMTGLFSVNIFTTDYISNGVTVPPMNEGQSLFIGINKIVGSSINWGASNITNNGLDSAYIASATYLFFEIQFIGGVYQVVKWILPFQITTGQILQNTILGGTTGDIAPATVTNYNLQAGVAVANLGYTPANSNLFPVSNANLQAGVAVANLGYTPANSNLFPIGTSSIQLMAIVTSLLANQCVTTSKLSTSDFILPNNANGVGATGGSSSNFGEDGQATRDSSSNFGRNGQATGIYSSNFGGNGQATGDYSSNFGRNGRATGVSSSNFGENGQATGVSSSNFGGNGQATGDSSSNFGEDGQATGLASSNFGKNGQATGIYSSNFGGNGQATGDYSSNFGENGQATRDSSSNFGRNGQATGDYSSNFGAGGQATGLYSSNFGGSGKATGVSSSNFGENGQATGNNSSNFGEDGIALSNNQMNLGNSSISLFTCKVALTVTSDKRDKANIEDFSEQKAVSILSKIKPVTYKDNHRGLYVEEEEVEVESICGKTGERKIEVRKEKQRLYCDKGNISNYNRSLHEKAELAGDDTRIGFIAQEVEQVMKEETGDGFFGKIFHNNEGHNGITEDGSSMGIAYQNFIPILVAGFQAQQKEIEELKNKIKELK